MGGGKSFGKEDRLRVRRVKKRAPLAFSPLPSAHRRIRVMCCDTSHFFVAWDGSINSLLQRAILSVVL